MEESYITQEELSRQLKVFEVQLLRKIEDAIRKGVSHKCQLGFTEELKPEAQGFIHDVKQIGDGDFSRGMLEVAENHRWIAAVRKKSETASSAVLKAVAGFIAVALLTALAAGLVSKIK